VKSSGKHLELTQQRKTNRQNDAERVSSTGAEGKEESQSSEANKRDTRACSPVPSPGRTEGEVVLPELAEGARSRFRGQSRELQPCTC